MRKKVQEKKPAKPAVAEKIETVDSASRVVLVLRHAKAQPKSGKPDFNRRLTKQGREDAVQVGKKIAREFGRVDFVLTSAAPRALATATAAAAAAGIPRDKIRSYKLLYAAAADKWVARMRRLPDDAKTVLLVGHNPECEDLIALLGGARVEMKKSALAALRFAGRWNEIGPASCRLRNHFPAGKPTRKSNVPPQNRELSWLSFNDRVLQEADDSRVPPLDRLLFLGIVSSNLDEFFRVRVGSLEHILRRAKGRKHHKETREVLTAVQQRASRLQRRLEHTLTNICRLLAERHRVQLVEEHELTAEERAYCRSYCDSRVRTGMTILTNLGSETTARVLETDSVYLAVTMSARGKSSYALLRLPTDRSSRFVELPPAAGVGKKRLRVVWLDDAIRVSLPDIFGQFGFERFTAHTVKLTRSAEISDDDFVWNFSEQFSRTIKQRAHGRFVRLIYDQEMPRVTLRRLVKQLQLGRDCSLVAAGRYHNLRDLQRFPRPLRRAELATPPLRPVAHPQLSDSNSLLDACAASDHLLCFPYHDFSLILKLLREASIDPDVSEICLTIYRLAHDSQVADALLNAIANGKRVCCVIEPRARFDEEANLRWARTMEEAGVIVSRGIDGYKTHAKLCLITRAKKRGQARDLAIVGTGNYNERTAKIYSDMSLITADARIVQDARALFRFIRDPARAARFDHLLVSPREMRDKFSEMIEHEIENAAAGKPASIRLKLNNLIDRPLVALLERAAEAGVEIDLVVRGTLGIDPEAPRFGGRMRAISVIDSLLEHARVLIFENGGKPRVFIGSADWMRRNLDRRVEIFAPVLDPNLRDELIDFFRMQMSDNVKARILNAAQDNARVPAVGKLRRAQAEIRAYYGKRAQAAAAAKPPVKKSRGRKRAQAVAATTKPPAVKKRRGRAKAAKA